MYCHGCGTGLAYDDKDRGAAVVGAGVLCPPCARLNEADADDLPR